KNAGSAAADIHIVYYDATGKPVGVDANASLAPNATWIVPQTNGHSFDPGAAGSGLVLSSQPLAAFVNEFAPGGSDATSYTGINEVGPNGQFSSYDAVNAGSTTLNAPAALNNAYGGFYTGMGIQNTSNTAGTVTVDYYDATGAKTTTSQSIAANGYIGLFQGSSTEGPPANPLGYTAVIT